MGTKSAAGFQQERAYDNYPSLQHHRSRKRESYAASRGSSIGTEQAAPNRSG